MTSPNKRRIDWDELFIDGSFTPAKKGVPTLVKSNVEKVRSGWWWQLAREYLWHVPSTSASPSEIKLASEAREQAVRGMLSIDGQFFSI